MKIYRYFSGSNCGLESTDQLSAKDFKEIKKLTQESSHDLTSSVNTVHLLNASVFKYPSIWSMTFLIHSDKKMKNNFTIMT